MKKNSEAKFLTFRKQVLRMTQSEVAEKLGVSTAAVGNWERRDSEPNGKLLWSMIQLFQLNPDWLFYDKGDPQLKMSDVSTNETNESSNLSVVVDLGSISIPLEHLAATVDDLKELTERISQVKKSLNP